MDFLINFFEFGGYLTVLGAIGIVISGFVIVSTPKDEPEKRLVFSNKKEFMIFSFLGMFSSALILVQSLFYYILWHAPQTKKIEQLNEQVLPDEGKALVAHYLAFLILNYGQFIFPTILGIIFFGFFKRFLKRSKKAA